MLHLYHAVGQQRDFLLEGILVLGQRLLFLLVFLHVLATFFLVFSSLCCLSAFGCLGVVLRIIAGSLLETLVGLL